jgi:hypothetical protein
VIASEVRASRLHNKSHFQACEHLRRNDRGPEAGALGRQPFEVIGGTPWTWIMAN